MLSGERRNTDYLFPSDLLMSIHLERQIDHLKQKIVFVGSCVEEAIAKAVTALIAHDRELGVKVVEADDEIDRLEVDVEEECLKTLALHQPVAADLRFVITVLKINNDFERMADIAVNIAKRAIFLTDCDTSDYLPHLRRMATVAQAMVKRSVDALVFRDVKLARQVREEDDDLDTMRREFHARIREALRLEPDNIECLLKLNSVSKHIERLGDMATNVAEDVIYMVEGEIVRHRHEW